jgi:hypothetical protein
MDKIRKDLLIEDISKLDGIKLKPLFYSEINSSYILKDLFENKSVIEGFIKHSFNISSKVIQTHREMPYDKVGSIDLFITFIDQLKGNCALVIEVKVHDYLSATQGQIIKYYEAVKNDIQYEEVYVVYLTQFNLKNYSDIEEIEQPPTIREFDKLVNKYQHTKEHFLHINWLEFHDFINSYYLKFTPEQKLMVSLQKSWIKDQINQDKLEHKVRTGQRAYSELFDGSDPRNDNLRGNVNPHNGRENYEIDLLNYSMEELDKLLNFIFKVAGSSMLNSKYELKTDAVTVIAAQKMFSELSRDVRNFKLLSFYSKLFDFVISTTYLQLNGTGNKGFSITSYHNTIQGLISICTLYKSHKLVFALSR